MDTRYDGYRPLNTDGGEIRLVEFIITDRVDQHEWKVRHFALEEAPPFVALSYVWTDTGGSFRCKIGEGLGRTAITSSLEDAMAAIGIRQWHLHARAAFAGDAPPPPIFVWADAVCINQNDNDEKQRQVAMMRRIYQRAVAVWAWLGPAGDDNDGPRALQTLARLGSALPCPWPSNLSVQRDALQESTQFSSIRRLLRENMANRSNSTAPVPIPGTTTPGPDYMRIIESMMLQFRTQDPQQNQQQGTLIPLFASVLSMLTDGAIIFSPTRDFTFFGDGRGAFGLHPRIQRFLDRPFWSRVWILQELFLARDLVFLCGDQGQDNPLGFTAVSGVAVCSAIRMLGDMLRVSGAWQRSIALGAPAMQRVGAPPFALGAYLQGRSKALSGNPSNTNSTADVAALGLGELLDVMVRMGVRATDPRDMVYGILGITEEQTAEGIPIEYAAPPGDVYVRATYQAILHTGDLRLVVLACCCREAAGIRRQQYMRSLPTWVPDLSWTLDGIRTDPIQRSLVDDSVRVGVAAEDGRPTLTLQGSAQGVVVERAEPLLASTPDDKQLFVRLSAMVNVLLATIRKFHDGLSGKATLASIQDGVMLQVLSANPALGSADIFDLQYVGDRDITWTEMYTRWSTMDPSVSTADGFLDALGDTTFYIFATSFTTERGVFQGLLGFSDNNTAYETRRRTWGALGQLPDLLSMLSRSPELMDKYYRLDGQTRDVEDDNGRSHSIRYLERLYQAVSLSLSTMFVLDDGLVGSGARDAEPGDIVVSVCDDGVSFVLRPLSTLERDKEIVHVLCDCPWDGSGAVDVTLVGESV
ncbi:hypothetical protein OQA88_13381 [Cercophora sp. LCS_1]